MIINRVPDGDKGDGEGRGVDRRQEREDSAHEYRTASELFDIMAKDQNFHDTALDSLRTGDLVLLYKNIDLGTRIMPTDNGVNTRRPNQYVETVVYNDDADSDSDVSEIYSNEDLHDVMLINKERIDFLTNHSSLGNSLCHKFGDLQLETSDLKSEYQKHFIFKDPYIKEQLRNLQLMNNSHDFEETILPASLLDYICCKRLEDNYNFYMDNIIRYVKHTIEQLKRISNGDYLTDKAKEKWREVEHTTSDIKTNKDTKALATSTSIPLHIEPKIGNHSTTWDDIVHSEVDIRSLSKILEKKIIVDLPKFSLGPYKLLSTCYAENLIITCKKDQSLSKEAEELPRVDIVLNLERSDSGRVISNINSIVILQAPSNQSNRLPIENHSRSLESPDHSKILEETVRNNITTVSGQNYVFDISREDGLENSVQITEIDPNNNQFHDEIESEDTDEEAEKDNFYSKIMDSGSDSYSDNLSTPSAPVNTENAQGDHFGKSVFHVQNEASFKLISPDELRITMHRLNMQSTLPEETGEDSTSQVYSSVATASRKKSPTKARIKSPYENKSFLIEEKKRRRLLEIRERREKKKLALAENCKISKHKYGITPQHSSSVTRLSITNKSFYNSIYGQNTNLDSKTQKARNRKDVKRETEDVKNESEIVTVCPIRSPDENNRKFTDRSYYLDDTVTEMMLNEMSKNEDVRGMFSPSTSEMSNEFRANINLLSHLIGTSDNEDEIREGNSKRLNQILTIKEDQQDISGGQSECNIIPLKNENVRSSEPKDDLKKTLSAVECRKSIDKIYELLKKQKPNNIETVPSQVKIETVKSENLDIDDAKMSSTVQCSDSGTSLKHHLTSSNPSYYSFGKNSKNVDTANVIEPKVIISSKSQNTKPNLENCKKDLKKKTSSPSEKISENPLKAISQLLREFDNVKKNRQNSATDGKSSRRPDNTNAADSKFGFRQNITKRNSRLEQYTKDNTLQPDKNLRVVPPRDKKPRQPNSAEGQKNVHNSENKLPDKYTKKRVIDLIDEVKEARGEAVRGPSKLNSRLNTLAQPKKHYVVAHSEEYHYKYGRNLMTDRLQKLAATGPNTVDRNKGSLLKTRGKRMEPESQVSPKPHSSPQPPLERTVRFRLSGSNSPCRKEPKSPERRPALKQNMHEAPETSKKKMMAVESYVNNHYGRSTSPQYRVQHSMQISRIPISDSMTDSAISSLASNEKVSKVANKHRIVDTMVKYPLTLQVHNECRESESEGSKIETDNYITTERNTLTDSEYNVDIYEDKNLVTAVENIGKISNSIEHSSQELDDTSMVQISSSASQLERLGDALFQRMPVGSFQRRLRLKNLTLTPKHSMQQVVFLQSGDAGTSSLVLKSTVSQNITVNKKEDIFSDIKTLPGFSKSTIDWELPNFPMQVTTVGYAFPTYKNAQNNLKSAKMLNHYSHTSLFERNVKSDKDCQCYKGEPIQPPVHKDAQTANSNEKLMFSKVIVCDQINTENLTNTGKELDKNKISQSTAFTEMDQLNDVTKTHTGTTTDKINQSDNSDHRCAINDDVKLVDTATENVKVDTVTAAANCEPVDYSSSLDMLVGLLNEIKKITTCQAHITSNQDVKCNDLETFLNNVAPVEDSVHCPQDAVSVKSFGKFGVFESNPSLYSFYLTNGLAHKIHSMDRDIVFVDKDVGGDVAEKEFVNTITDVPSVFLPVRATQSTNVTKSLLGIISVPSNQSLISIEEFNRSSIKAVKDMIDCSHAAENNKLQQSPKDENEGSYKVKKIIKNHRIPIKSNRNIKHDEKQKVLSKCIQDFNNTNEFDPIMKMKRDILVTVYSILVFTVFAAMSFPRFMISDV